MVPVKSWKKAKGAIKAVIASKTVLTFELKVDISVGTKAKTVLADKGPTKLAM
jgi:hypothetical protein